LERHYDHHYDDRNSFTIQATGHKLMQFTTVSEKHNVNRTHLLKSGKGAGLW